MTDHTDATHLAPDEKLCPFCAETIKKAAIRCRFCQSDLSGIAEPPPPPAPVEAPAAEADEEAAAPPAPLFKPDVESEQPRRLGWLSTARTMIALLVLCLVLACTTAFAWYRSEHPSDAGTSKDAITSSSARDSGLQAATRLTQKIFSYDWKTFDADAASSEKVLGATFRKDYAATIAKTRQTAVANQVKQTAQASATSIVSASDDKVVALVFMNVLATGKTGGQHVTTSRLLVTLTPSGGDWRISSLKQL
jgi:Mce-associated membrane protein